MSTKAMDELGEEKGPGSATCRIFSPVFLPVASEKGTQLTFVLPSHTYGMIYNSTNAVHSGCPLKTLILVPQAFRY